MGGQERFLYFLLLLKNSVRDLWHFGADPDTDLDPQISTYLWLMDPDPALFVSDLHNANKIFMFIPFGRYGTFTSFFKNKKS